MPSKLVNNLIEVPKPFNPNINLYHFQPKYELCWRIKYFLITQREIKYLGIFGQNFEILIVVSQPAFTAGTKNSLLNATIREEAMQPWALLWAVHHMVSWIPKTEFGIFTNAFIFYRIVITKKTKINKETRLVLIG